MKIDDWRKKIDAIDTAMLHLLNLRAELALEVGRMKKEEGVALRAPRREREILNRMKGLNPGPLDGKAIGKIYQSLLAESIRMQELHGFGDAKNSKADPRAARGKRQKRQ